MQCIYNGLIRKCRDLFERTIGAQWLRPGFEFVDIVKLSVWFNESVSSLSCFVFVFMNKDICFTIACLLKQLLRVCSFIHAINFAKRARLSSRILLADALKCEFAPKCVQSVVYAMCQWNTFLQSKCTSVAKLDPYEISRMKQAWLCHSRQGMRARLCVWRAGCCCFPAAWFNNSHITHLHGDRRVSGFWKLCESKYIFYSQTTVRSWWSESSDINEHCSGLFSRHNESRMSRVFSTLFWQITYCSCNAVN